LLGRLVARFAVNELVAAANKKRIAETEQASRGSALPHMSCIKFTQLPIGGSKFFEKNREKLQTWKHVVASSLRPRR
jgi:hypothetical protein